MCFCLSGYFACAFWEAKKPDFDCIFNSETNINAADFIRKIDSNIEHRIAGLNLLSLHCPINYLNVRREYALRMKKSVKKNGIEVRKAVKHF